MGQGEQLATIAMLLSDVVHILEVIATIRMKALINIILPFSNLLIVEAPLVVLLAKLHNKKFKMI